MQQESQRAAATATQLLSAAPSVLEASDRLLRLEALGVRVS